MESLFRSYLDVACSTTNQIQRSCNLTTTIELSSSNLPLFLHPGYDHTSDKASFISKLKLQVEKLEAHAKLMSFPASPQKLAGILTAFASTDFSKASDALQTLEAMLNPRGTLHHSYMPYLAGHANLMVSLCAGQLRNFLTVYYKQEALTNPKLKQFPNQLANLLHHIIHQPKLGPQVSRATLTKLVHSLLPYMTLFPEICTPPESCPFNISKLQNLIHHKFVATSFQNYHSSFDIYNFAQGDFLPVIFSTLSDLMTQSMNDPTEGIERHIETLTSFLLQSLQIAYTSSPNFQVRYKFREVFLEIYKIFDILGKFS